MGRPREFNENDVLAGAIALFGTRGFNAIPIDTVLTEVGLNRSSFYKIYGSKHGLLRRALEEVCKLAEVNQADRHCKDLIVVTLVEVAPLNKELRNLSLQAASLCFDGDADLGKHVVSRTHTTPREGEPS